MDWRDLFSLLTGVVGLFFTFYDPDKSLVTIGWICLLFLSGVFFVIIFSERCCPTSNANGRWVIAILALVVGLSLAAYDYRHRLFGTQSQYSRWRVIEERAIEFSSDLEFWKTNMLDTFAANGLITIARRNELFLELNKKLANNGDKNVALLKDFYFRLLTEELPATGDEGFISFCRIMESKSNSSAIGTEPCQICNLCRSELLNQTGENEVSVSVPSTVQSALMPVDRQAERPLAKLVIDSSCKNQFNKREKDICASLLEMGIEATVYNNSHDSAASDSTAVATQTSSLVCGGSSISATLSVEGVFPTEIDTGALQHLLARVTDIQEDPKKQIQLHSVSVTGGSLVILRLSPDSGFELLCLVTNSKRLNQFAQSLGTIFHSSLNKTIVHLQVSALHSFEVVVEPCGGFTYPRKPIFDLGLPDILVDLAFCTLLLCVGFALGIIYKRHWRNVQSNQTNVVEANTRVQTELTANREETETGEPQAAVETNEPERDGAPLVTSGSPAEALDRPRTPTVRDPEQQSREHMPHDRKCCRDDIKKIYTKVSFRWRHIARHLGLADHVIQRIEKYQGQGDDVDDKCYKMLKRWIDTRDDKVKSATVFNLFDALVEAECTMDAIEESGIEKALINEWKSTSVPLRDSQT